MNQRRILAAVYLLSCPFILTYAKDRVIDSLGVEKAVAASPAKLLTGEFSGVRVTSVDGSPYGEQNVYIRGVNTIRGNSQPLWIVDGVMIGSSLNQNLDAFYMRGGQTSNGDQLPDYSGYSYTSPIGNFGWLNPYEIESIEVLKDISATAVYGMAGANGVIIVKTRRSSSQNRNVFFSAGEGIDMASQSGDAFRTGFRSMQEVGVNGMIGNSSYYNISGFFRYGNAPVRNTNATVGGMTVSLETTANELYQFGLHSHLYYGDYNSAHGTNYIGAPSTMILSRYPDCFYKENVLDWQNSYDDEVLDYRTVNSVWLRINLLPMLYLKMSAGADYQNQTRYLWYGSGTEFGRKFSGAAGILNNSLLSYNFRGEAAYSRNFATIHHVGALFAVDMKGNLNRTNAMCGTDFDVPFLRSKGLSSSASVHSIRKFSRDYNQLGLSGTLKYDYNGLCGIDGTFRFDRTRRFDDNSTFFPSANAYVDFKRLIFQNNTLISALQLKGGYGEAGYEIDMPYEYLVDYINNVPLIDNDASFYYDGINRLNSKEYNVGIEAGLINNRVNLSVKYYDKRTDDMFKVYNFGKKVEQLYVEAKKWSVLQQRTTSIKNNGFEFDADIQAYTSKNWNWSLYGNVAYNMNKVLSLDELDEVNSMLRDGKYVAANKEGLSLGQAYGYKTGADKEPINYTPEILGNTIPKSVFGFGTTLRWTRFILDAKFSGAAGFNIINANNLVRDALYYISSEDVECGDYIRLDHVGVTYKVPSRVKWIKDLNVSISAHNLLTLTRYSGWNPDVNSFGATVRGNGVDYGSYPMNRSIVVGLSVKF